MLLLKVFILVVLLLIVVQDFRSRSVYWFLFPVLSVLFFIADLCLHRSFFDIGCSVIGGCSFLLLQYFLVSLYFSIKNRRWVNITAQLLGWGDILLLLSLTFYLSVLNLVFFYVAGLIGSLVVWLAWRGLAKNENKHVPLAGLQAIFLSIIFILDWCWLHFNLTDDAWILGLIHR